MSIIQEALKKAERHVKTPGRASDAPEAPITPYLPPDRSSVEAPRPASGHDPKSVAILLIILVATALFAAKQFYPKNGIKPKSPVAAAPARPAIREDRPAAVVSKSEEHPALPGVLFQQPKPDAAANKASEFVLNGIMYLEGSPRAIVNDSMVETGDMVDGARVTKIDRRNVLLEYNGSQIRLDLK